MQDDDDIGIFELSLAQMICGIAPDFEIGKVKHIVEQTDSLIMLNTRMTPVGAAALKKFETQKLLLTPRERVRVLVVLLEAELKRHAN